MGGSYIKMILREFKKSFGRFAAIFGIVALGVGFLSGLLITTPDMNNSVDTYYDNHNMADIFIKGTMGLTKNDLDEVESNKNVKDIMPAFVIDKLMELNGKELLATKIYGIPLLHIENETIINKLELLQGRMPENNKECLVERKSQFIKDIKIGSSLKISEENKDYEDIDDLYKVDEYQVVGIVGNSFHFAMEREFSNVGSGKLDTIIYVDRSSYALEEFTDFYIVLEDAIEMNSFSSEYQVYTEKVRKNLKLLGEARSKERKIEIIDKANKKLEDGYEKYYDEKNKAYIELADALEEIQDGKKELQKAAIDIKDAKIKLQDAKQTLKEDNEKALNDIAEGEADLKQASIDLIEAEEKLKDAKIKLADGEKKYNDGFKEYLDGKVEFEDGKRKFEKGKKEFEDSEKEFEDGKRKFKDGKLQLEKAKRDLDNGEIEYKNGLNDLISGKRELLSGIEPMSIELGYSFPEQLISTSKGQADLRLYITGAKKQIEEGISQATEGKSKLETGIQQLKAAKQQKIELENSLQKLKIQLQEIEQAKPQLEQGILELKYAIGTMPPGEELESLKIKLSELENQLVEVNSNIPKIKGGIEQTESGILEIEKNLQQTPIEPLELQLSELNKTIADLRDKQSKIPEANFLIDSWYEIKNGEIELEKGKRELDKGFIEYKEGLDKLKNSEIELSDGEIKLKDGKNELKKNEDKLSTADNDLKEAEKDLESARKELQDGKKEYEDGLLEFKDGQKEYQDGLVEIEDAKVTLKEEINKATMKIQDGEKKLQEGIIDYEEGIFEIKDGEKKYADGKVGAEEELADAYDKLLEAETKIKDLENPEWYVLDRDSNMSYVSFQLNADKVDAISTVFPIFFYLVAGLVALTTMTRMIEEERTQIGVLKALGYRKSTIILKYILYCGLASTLGSIFGQMVGFQLIPRVIWNTYGVMYHLPEFITDYNKKIAFLSSGIAILSTLAATFFAANDALKEKPALLMLPRAPKKGKRILLEKIKPLWSAMSFNLKSTARNILRYKKHFYMTVIGVSGCTALLVTGFGLRDSIKDIGTLQFDEIYKYQLNIQLEEDSNESILDTIKNNSKISDTLQIYADKGYLKFNGETEDINLVAVDDIDKLSDYVLFRNRKNSKLLDFDPNKIIITEKISEVLKIKVGDTITFENSDEIESKFVVDVITENYIGNYIYMDKSKYELAFNKKLENNNIYAKTEDLDSDEEDKLIEVLYENDGILNAEFISQSRGIFDNLIVGINYIVIVIIIASGLLAFIVLYNLTNININERRRELATLKVLGFHNNEVAAYIFREITVLALIGTFVGLVLGKYLHQFIIITVEDPKFMFARDISILSYIISAVITMIFSVIVDLFMIKKIKNIKMVDSMKAND